MDTKDTQNVLVSVMVFGAVLGAFAIVTTYVYMTAAGLPVNDKFAALAQTTFGALLPLVGTVLKDWMAKATPAK